MEESYMKRYQKVAVFAISTCMVVSFLAGCGRQNDSSSNTLETKQGTKAEQENAMAQDSVQEQEESTGVQGSGIIFPLEEQVTLTMWAPFNVNAASVMEDFNGSVVFQEMEKMTNVHIEFIHPAIGQDSEQFNLMIASQEYPDMIMGGISNSKGGGDLAVEEGVFLQLNDLI